MRTACVEEPTALACGKKNRDVILLQAIYIVVLTLSAKREPDGRADDRRDKVGDASSCFKV